MSVIGTTLNAGAVAYSPWFKRGALNAVFSAELISVSAGGTLDVGVEHRNNDETVPSSAGAFPSIASTGVETGDLSGLKENVRFVYTSGGASGNWSHFRVLNPAWYDA